LRNLLGGEHGRTKAYSLIRSYMTKKRFEHRQGSAYMSESTLSDAEIYDLTDDLVRKHPWLAQSIKGYDVTNVGTTHDYTFVFEQYQREDREKDESGDLIV
jgi:virulence-associated protein VapD